MKFIEWLDLLLNNKEKFLTEKQKFLNVLVNDTDLLKVKTVDKFYQLNKKFINLTENDKTFLLLENHELYISLAKSFYVRNHQNEKKKNSFSDICKKEMELLLTKLKIFKEKEIKTSIPEFEEMFKNEFLNKGLAFQSLIKNNNVYSYYKYLYEKNDIEKISYLMKYTTFFQTKYIKDCENKKLINKDLEKLLLKNHITLIQYSLMNDDLKIETIKEYGFEKYLNNGYQIINLKESKFNNKVFDEILKLKDYKLIEKIINNSPLGINMLNYGFNELKDYLRQKEELILNFSNPYHVTLNKYQKILINKRLTQNDEIKDLFYEDCVSIFKNYKDVFSIEKVLFFIKKDNVLLNFLDINKLKNPELWLVNYYNMYLISKKFTQLENLKVEHYDYLINNVDNPEFLRFVEKEKINSLINNKNLLKEKTINKL